MTEPVDHNPETDPITREAIAWVVRLTSGEATTGDASELARWRSLSPAHDAAFRRAARLWRGFEAVATESSAGQSAGWLPQVSPMIARRAFLGGAIAAGAAYAVVNPPLQLWPSWGELLADYRTEKGEQRQVAIGPDISLELSTLTSVAVRSSADQPRIELISGEAAITAKSSAPLIVVAGDGRIVASQASFNARCLDGIVSVTCLTGGVTIEQGRDSMELAPGQQITYSATGFGPAEAVDTQQTTSWRSGMLIFQNKPLADVIEEINRYRPGRIIITNSELSRRVVNGTFRRDQLDTFVAQVQQLFGAKATQLPAGLLLLS